jgi:hypothetical protein
METFQNDAWDTYVVSGVDSDREHPKYEARMLTTIF